MLGSKKAMEQEADWIWVSDDDAYLKEDALKQASDIWMEGRTWERFPLSAEK